MPSNKNKSKVILVTGATGHQGGAAIRHLRERGFACRALTRDPGKPEARNFVGHGVEAFQGNMDDQASLTRAVDGVDGVFGVTTPYEGGVEAEVRQGINLANAAKRSRSSHFVYTSVGSADQQTGIPHFDSKFRIEQHLRGTGMRCTILRPVFFMENWLGMRAPIESGTLALPLSPHTRLQMIAVDDIGGVTAMAFEKPGKWPEPLEVAGDELSMAELAQVFTRVTGRDVQYQQVPWGDFEAKSGPEITTMYRWFENTGYHVDISRVRQDYPKLSTFDRWLNANWHTATRTA